MRHKESRQKLDPEGLKVEEKRLNILVRSPNWIGDQVLAYPFFYRLRQRFKDAKITAVCVPWVADVQFKNCVDAIHVLPRPTTLKIRDKVKVLYNTSAALKAQSQWDLAISLPNSFSSAALLWGAGARLRRGYGHEGRGIFLNDRLDWKKGGALHRAQAYLDLVPAANKWGADAGDASAFFDEPPLQDLDEPKRGELSRFDFKTEWPGFEALAIPKEPYWILAPGATAESRRWPIEYFVALAENIIQKTGWKGLIIGGPSEAPLAASLIMRVDGLEDWTAQGAIPSLAPLFAGAKMSVTNESGLAHVAALCGSFVQIICGAADPRRTRPIGPGRVQVAVNPVDCWPCERNHCHQPRESAIRCLRGIEPSGVWGEIERGLRIEGRLK